MARKLSKDKGLPFFFFGVLAQLGERYAGSVEVRGSNPLRSTNRLLSLYLKAFFVLYW